MEHEDILHRCFRCGYCKLPANFTDINCPAYLAYRFETYSPGGRMWLLRAWLDNEVKGSMRLAEIMFSCAACGNCVAHCAMPDFRDRLLLAMTAGKEALLDAGRVPPGVRDYLTRMQAHGNAYGKPAKKRADWTVGNAASGADDTVIPAFSDQEYLFYAGDVGAYDPRGSEIARSVAGVLQKAGISLGVLPEGESDDGNDVGAMGESLLFRELAAKNIKAFDRAGVRKIITLSPHSFNTFKNDYPALGGTYQVFHYTQVLAFAMNGLDFKADPTPQRVTFHDPCYLGRHNMDYESPRMILRAIPGLQLTEMARNRKNALCCGAGGGNFFSDVLGGAAESAAQARALEAEDAGALILAVACPLCAIMLEDAAKTAGVAEKIRIREITEIIKEAMDL